METLSFDKGWYLLYTNAKQERKVAVQFDTMKLTNYLPMMQVTREWSDRLKILTVPLFPSYIFVYLECSEDYNRSLEAKGALHYVRFGRKIAKVAQKVISDIQMIVGTGKTIEVSFSEFQQGETVVISDGPLAGLGCEIVRYKNKNMLLVRIDLLQRSLLVEVPAAYLCKL